MQRILIEWYGEFLYLITINYILYSVIYWDQPYLCKTIVTKLIGESRGSMTCVFIKKSSLIRHVESMKNKNRDVFIKLGLGRD